MEALTFTKVGESYEATFTASGSFNLHIEFTSTTLVNVSLHASSKSGGRYGKQWEMTTTVVDQDFMPLTDISKTYKVVCGKNPTVAEVR